LIDCRRKVRNEKGHREYRPHLLTSGTVQTEDSFGAHLRNYAYGNGEFSLFAVCRIIFCSTSNRLPLAIPKKCPLAWVTKTQKVAFRRNPRR